MYSDYLNSLHDAAEESRHEAELDREWQRWEMEQEYWDCLECSMPHEYLEDTPQ